MGHVIIFDAADHCGKTTMAKELSKRTGIPYFKNSDEHRYFLTDPNYFISAIRYVDTYFTSYLESTGNSIILDRAWPSEWVYSKVLGRSTDMDVLSELDRRHAALGTKIIIPYRSSYEGITDKYESVTNNLQRISDTYAEFAAWSRCDCLRFNVDDEDLEREMTCVQNFMSKNR
jgi:thymidylate kinase